MERPLRAASICLTVVFCAIVGTTNGSSPAQTPQPPRPDCGAAAHRQFDFWIGDWEVTVQGKPAGTNRIESDLNRCVLIEHWTAARGSRGTSLNFYDRAADAWFQTWIDDGGNALRLKGGLANGRMVMQSDPRPRPDGGVGSERITWSPEMDGSVRQLWERSTDGGKTWSTVFDGRYARKG